MVQSKVSNCLIKVDRALSEIRRGGTIILRLNNNEGCLLRSLEMMVEGDAVEMGALCGSSPMLVITKNRATALGKRLSKSYCCATLPLGNHTIPALMNFAISLPHSSLISQEISIVGEKENSLADYSTRLLRKAKLAPAAIICRIASRDKSYQDRLAADTDMLILEERDIKQYYQKKAEAFKIVTRANVPISVDPNAEVVMFRAEVGDEEHFAVIVGGEITSKAPLLRIHSQCLTGDVLGSLKCDCGDQLAGALQLMAKNSGGILIYLAQEGRDIGLLNKMRAYGLQSSGLDTIDANHVLGFEADERDFLPAVKILNELNVNQVKLITNNPKKIDHLACHGIKVVERVPLSISPNEHNLNYIETKKSRAGHLS